jgi:hypothetical protein
VPTWMFEHPCMIKALASEPLKWMSDANGSILISQLLDVCKLKSVELNEIQLVYTWKSVF